MKTFGLIGKSLEHSFSKQYFTEKFKKAGIKEVEYKLYPIKDVSELIELVQVEKSLCGLNVTIPFKADVLGLLNNIETEARSIGAVNTIKIERNAEQKAVNFIGYNTDVYGFECSLKPMLKHNHTAALVLGTGGSSRAISYVLNKLGISFLQVSREPKNNAGISYSGLDEVIIKQHNLIINCTPLGMFPNIEQCPDLPFNSIGTDHLVYDLIYNPKETALLKRCKEQGAVIKNGLEMLELQAEKSWEIWNQ